MLSKHTLIVADDHPLFRGGLCDLLEKTGRFDVLAAVGSGRELLERIREREPDIVLLDHDMPEGSGYDVATTLRHNGAGVRLVLLTAVADAQLISDYAALAPDGMLLKTDDTIELLRGMDTIAAGGTYFSAPIRALIRKQSLGKQLSARERQVIRHVASGLSTKEISRMMGLSPKTVDNHRTRIMQKLEIHNVVELVNFAHRAGLA